jgi:glutamate dehydrogenase (NADP+)
MHITWTAEEVDKQLHQIMNKIHEQVLVLEKKKMGPINYLKGANVAGF